MTNLVAATVWAIVTNVAQAQIVIPSDIGVTLSVTPSTNLAPGEQMNVTLSVTNYGPERVDVFSLRSSDILDALSLVRNSNDCALHTYLFTDPTGRPTSSLLQWNVTLGGGPTFFNVGETITCHFKLALAAQAPQSLSLSFGFPFFADINPDNDTASVQLQRAAVLPPAPIPVLSPVTQWLLAGLLVATAGARRARLKR
ncbi:hypothetical protein [Dokdonella soli]|uniref:IPTL-CTERM sorting domain-containing protein n=1 Tax=Dokdonella soli TaxID=529810 RepID=A0ABP3U4S1_9GAMM